MRKAIFTLIFIVVATSVFAVGPMKQQSQMGEECVIPASPNISEGGNTLKNGIVGASAEGQRFTTLAGDEKLGRICIWAEDASGVTSFTLRIGASNDLNTYMEEWVSGEIHGDTKRCFDSIDNDVFLGLTTYYWGVIETGGEVKLGYAADAYGGFLYNSSGWILGAEYSGNTHYFEIYWLECGE